MRNAAVTSIAPTGSISMIANTSSSIEPNFGLAYFKAVLGGEKLFYINEILEKVLKQRGYYKKEIINEILKSGDLNNVDVDDDIRDVFITTYDVAPEEHVKMQAVFQKHVDLAVSKTVNLPENSTIDDVKKIFLLAWKLKCKGITVYRKGSREDVFHIGVCKKCSL